MGNSYVFHAPVVASVYGLMLVAMKKYLLFQLLTNGIELIVPVLTRDLRAMFQRL